MPALEFIADMNISVHCFDTPKGGDCLSFPRCDKFILPKRNEYVRWITIELMGRRGVWLMSPFLSSETNPQDFEEVDSKVGRNR